MTLWDNRGIKAKPASKLFFLDDDELRIKAQSLIGHDFRAVKDSSECGDASQVG